MLVELLRPIPPLSSEEPEAIMRLCIRLDAVHDLGLVDDRTFIVRILPLMSGSLLKFWGDSLRVGSDWDECKSRLLMEYFPHFVCERMIRDLIVFNFQGEGQALRLYIEQVFAAAKFLQYGASEQELIDRVLMNFHPRILSQTAFIDRPRSLKELYQAVALIEEKVVVAQERQRLRSLRTDAPNSRSGAGLVSPRAGFSPGTPLKCWNCNSTGHLRRECPRRVVRTGNGQVPGGRQTPRARTLSGLKRITATPFQPLLWVPLELKVGKVPALIDTGAQFSCVRADVAEFLYHMDEPCSFTQCAVVCALADGQRCHVTDAVNLHAKLLSFSWTHEFKVLNGGPFPAILGIDFLERTQMMVNAASKTFSFGFAPDKIGHFSRCDWEGEDQPFLQGLLEETSGMLGKGPVWPDGTSAQGIIAEFPTLFSSTLGSARVTPYEIELSDMAPVRSPPYRCAPPKLEIFRGIVNELLEQGVVRPSKSPYASPAFLVPKGGMPSAW